MPRTATTPKTKSHPGTATDEDRARALLLWCRTQRIHVGQIAVGDVTLAGIVDLTTAGLQAPTAAGTAPSSDIRSAFGGGALARLAAEQRADADSVVTDPDDVG